VGNRQLVGLEHPVLVPVQEAAARNDRQVRHQTELGARAEREAGQARHVEAPGPNVRRLACRQHGVASEELRVVEAVPLARRRRRGDDTGVGRAWHDIGIEHRHAVRAQAVQPDHRRGEERLLAGIADRHVEGDHFSDRVHLQVAADQLHADRRPVGRRLVEPPEIERALSRIQVAGEERAALIVGRGARPRVVRAARRRQGKHHDGQRKQAPFGQEQRWHDRNLLCRSQAVGADIRGR